MPVDAELPERIERQLAAPLPGRSAQETCAVEMSFGRHFGPPRHDARRAAVIALLFRRGDQWRLPMIVRPPQLLHHAGEVSLPGGSIEAGEEPQEAAVRELEEEVGIPRSAVRLLGRLSPLYVFSSNHEVLPVVGYVESAPEFELNALEVARLLEVPLEFLLEPTNCGAVERRERGVRARAPAYVWDGADIWGATCMILAEFVAVVHEAYQPEQPSCRQNPT